MVSESKMHNKAVGGRGQSLFVRALVALPILGLSGIMFRSFSMIGILGPMIERTMNESWYDWQGVRMPIIQDFYGIPFLDEMISPLTIIFGQMQFFSDPPFYWQALIFLTEVSGLYAILLLESYRKANQATLFQFPFLLAMLGQLFCIGNIAPIWFYLLHVFSPTEKLSAVNARLIDGAGAAIVLPTVILAYLVPHFPSYFHPSLEARHWWNWVWQLFPVWGSLTALVLRTTLASTAVLDNRADVVSNRNRGLLRTTVGVLAATSTAIYWYSLYTSENSIAEMFLPRHFLSKPQDPAVVLQNLIQFDQICCESAVLLWLAYQIGDLKTAGVFKASWAQILRAAITIGFLGGPGTLALVGWLVREEVLQSLQHEKAL